MIEEKSLLSRLLVLEKCSIRKLSIRKLSIRNFNLMQFQNQAKKKFLCFISCFNHLHYNELLSSNYFETSSSLIELNITLKIQVLKVLVLKAAGIQRAKTHFLPQWNECSVTKNIVSLSCSNLRSFNGSKNDSVSGTVPPLTLLALTLVPFVYCQQLIDNPWLQPPQVPPSGLDQSLSSSRTSSNGLQYPCPYANFFCRLQNVQV